MGLILFVAIGGAVGSVLRFLVSKLVQEKAGIEFPIGTFVVNVVGAFLIGIFFAYLVERMSVPASARAMLITGFLGGFTTFSTFSYESVNLLQEGEVAKLLLYVGGTNVVGIAMTLLGYNLGRSL